jgi:UDP-glucuronate 4-epimerase
MNILLTGVAGFIGSNLSEKLISKHKIVGIDNFDPFYDRGLKEKNLEILQKDTNFEFIDGDILDYNLLTDLHKKSQFDIIIHLAAKAGVRPSLIDPKGYLRVNVEGTINLLNLAKEQKIENLIIASSSSIYGNNKKTPFSENDFVDNPISNYAASKKACELFAHSYAKLYHLKIILLRLFTVYGRRQRPDLAIAKFCRLIKQNQPIPFYGDGDTQRDYTYIDDILDGFIKSINWLLKQKKGVYEIFNLGENRAVKLKKLVSIIEEKLGKKAIINKLTMQQGDVLRTHADINKAKATFGYNPRTQIEIGIENYINWLDKNELA